MEAILLARRPSSSPTRRAPPGFVPRCSARAEMVFPLPSLKSHLVVKKFATVRANLHIMFLVSFNMLLMIDTSDIFPTYVTSNILKSAIMMSNELLGVFIATLRTYGDGSLKKEVFVSFGFSLRFMEKFDVFYHRNSSFLKSRIAKWTFLFLSGMNFIIMDS